jgi:dTDP-4-amino-4,6-dideoxygalactose transaminase
MTEPAFTETLPERILCLPMHARLGTADQDRVIEAIRDFVRSQTSRIAAE